MLTDEYDYELDMQAKIEDATFRKAVEAAINLLRMNILSPEQIAQAQNLPLEKVLELQKQITVQA